MDFEKIDRLAELLRKHGLQEIRVRDDKNEIVVIAPSSPASFMPTAGVPTGAMFHGMNQSPPFGAHLTQGHAGSAPHEGSGSHAKSSASVSHTQPQHAGGPATKGRTLKSPFVGTFYRSSAPGSDSFVEIGSRVKKGDVLCIVEAMKLMNEIEAEWDGVIKEILVDNEQPVEFDQALFVIE